MWITIAPFVTNTFDEKNKDGINLKKRTVEFDVYQIFILSEVGYVALHYNASDLGRTVVRGKVDAAG
ncbi:hypothetical protein LAX92_23225 [Escherichia coli]|uniref:hypothetical protein n=1 Tax=Escherichia coli TaxID=562 RepID=UPI00210703D9|nr:hypothetical protein [Escherichia coli]MCQ1917265.1 hypothetical protein [Escherichia coli]MDD8724752.1 hypothetical protein [Escherichia coli]